MSPLGIVLVTERANSDVILVPGFTCTGICSLLHILGENFKRNHLVVDK